MKRWRECPFMISLLINSNHFYLKLFLKLKYGIAYVICIRPS